MRMSESDQVEYQQRLLEATTAVADGHFGMARNLIDAAEELYTGTYGSGAKSTKKMAELQYQRLSRDLISYAVAGDYCHVIWVCEQLIEAVNNGIDWDLVLPQINPGISTHLHLDDGVVR